MTSLYYFKTHPLRVPKDQSTLPIGDVISACDNTIISPEIHPTAGAYIHYGGVELADMLTLTQPSIPEDKLKAMETAWYNSCGIVSKQLLFYLWWIISKELAHGNQSQCDKAFGGGKFDPQAVALCEKVCSGNYKSAVKAAKGQPVGPYVTAVEQHFRHGGWKSAYGGKKWADIALVFKQYIYGEMSAMIAADRAWTLVHNTGPIFNKGFYFKNANPIKVLNAQATHSVFDLGYDFLEKEPAYKHEINSAFKVFCDLSVAYIKTVKPEYEAGAEGSGGLLMAGTSTQDTPYPSIHTIGGYTIYTGERTHQ